MTPDTENQTSRPMGTGRRFELDWLRLLAILAVFLFHSLRFFDPSDWHVKNPATYQQLSLVMSFFGAWMMPLIFVISGASVFYALGKGRTGKYLGDKVLRLLVPFTVGLFTHVAWQQYLDRVTHHHFTGSFWSFLPVYVRGLDAFGGNFAWHGLHLWYLGLLFVFSVALLPLLAWLRRGSGRGVLLWTEKALALPGVVYLLAAPVIAALLLPNPTTLAGAHAFGGWSMVGYIPFFLGGFLLAGCGRGYEMVGRLRWVSLVLGLAATGALVSLYTAHGDPAFGSSSYAPFYAVYGLNSWFWVLAVLGFGIRHLRRPTPFLARANEAILPFYILHQPVLLTIGYFVVRTGLPDGLKWAAIALPSFALCVGLYEFAIRRFAVLRFLFGLKVSPRAAARPAVSEGAPAAAA